MKWGLVPAWASDPSIGSRMINARSETLAEKPSFKQALVRRRCLILADGFYEWQKLAGKRGPSQPYYFTRNNHRPFAFAGLWETWQPSQAAEPLLSCTIITCAANELVIPVHERMPVILDKATCWDWLSARPQIELLSMLQPYPAEQMLATRVSTLVNDAGREEAALIDPIH
jgi:putative SOS response-associated peptidase YedK